MPEPAKEDNEDNKVERNSIDSESGFEVSDEKVKLVDKLFFIFFAAFTSYALFGALMERHTHQWTRTSGITFVVLLGITPQGFYVLCWFYVKVWEGCVPRVFAFRRCLSAVFTVWGWMCSWNVAGISMGSSHSKFHTRDNVAQALDLYLFMVTFFSVTFTTLCNYVPNQYAERSSLGVYCCASFENIRFGRMVQVSVFLLGVDFLVSSSLSYVSGAAGIIAVFGWKKIKYIGALVLNLNDSCFKDVSFWLVNFYYQLLYNGILASTMLFSKTYADAASCFAVDWIQFGLRVALLARFGMQACPKLVTYALRQQLSNMCTPLPKFALAHGPQTAQRIMQAFYCLLEGEALSILFVTFFCFYVHFGLLQHSYKMFFFVPLSRKSGPLMLCLFSFSDLIQDCMATKLVARFSSFNYLTDRKLGWHSKYNAIFFMSLYYCLISGYGWNWPAMPGHRIRDGENAGSFAMALKMINPESCWGHI